MAPSLDIHRISATTPPAPGLRVQPTVTKLVDTSTCIGCKACEVACQEWNDLPPETTVQMGTYQTLPDMTANVWNLIRFNEHETDRLHWLMRKDQCMHCVEPGLPHRLPGAGRDRAICERHRRFPAGPVHRLRLLPDRMSVQRAEVRGEDAPRLQVHAVRRSRSGRPAAGVREGVSDELPAVRDERRDASGRRPTRRSTAGQRLSAGGRVRSAGCRRHRGRHGARVRRSPGAVRTASRIPSFPQRCESGRAR